MLECTFGVHPSPDPNKRLARLLQHETPSFKDIPLPLIQARAVVPREVGQTSQEEEGTDVGGSRGITRSECVLNAL